MSVLNIRFPTDISIGAVGGPGYSTDVVVLGSGHEQRNQNWSAARSSYDVSKAVVTNALRDELIAFFRIAKGRTHSFRLKDFTDFKASTTTGIFLSLGGVTYQLQKRYTHAGGTEDRDIVKPVNGTISVYKAGPILLQESVDYTIDYATGVLTALGGTPPVPVSWAGEFDVHARFDTDRLRLIGEAAEIFRSQSISVVEIRGA